MLDNLFNSVLVLSFVAISAVGSLTSPAETDELAATQTVAQLERVVITGRSLKSAKPA
nr:hypothetical protein [uncultured Roseateles sp.]